MARARNIKPSFFTNEDLAELPYEARLMFIGLWTLADREGRLEDRPKRIKMALFPADDVNAAKLIDMLEKAGFIKRYVVSDRQYIQVLNFKKHQNPHVNERDSTIPAPDQHGANPADSLIPDSLIPDSLIPEERNGANAPSHPVEFEIAMGKYPKRQGGNPRKDAFKAWNARLKEGHSIQEIQQGVERYAKYCDVTGKTGTEYVMQAKRFFGTGKEFLSDWEVTPGGANGSRPRVDNSAPGRVRAANGIRR